MKKKMEVKVIDSDLLETLEYFWKCEWQPAGWKVKKAIRIVWSWRKFRVVYRLVLHMEKEKFLQLQKQSS